MSVVSIEQKRPKHHQFATLRVAMQKMQSSLDMQKIAITEFHADIKELGEIMSNMKRNMQIFDQNLDAIPISQLGQEPRKLAQIMESAAA
tara:strand:+ start:3005 stop:3274 length:270 start_codon:yes stop_codon:yes gene_type:complete